MKSLLKYNEVKKICQPSFKKQIDPWFITNVSRRFSLPITWILLHTKVTANQVSVSQIVVSICAGVLIASGIPQLGFLGILIFWLVYVLDCVDGEIARYRKSTTIKGLYYDGLSDEIIEKIFWVSIGIHILSSTGSALASLCSFAMVIIFRMSNTVLSRIVNRVVEWASLKDTYYGKFLQNSFSVKESPPIEKSRFSVKRKWLSIDNLEKIMANPFIRIHWFVVAFFVVFITDYVWLLVFLTWLIFFFTSIREIRRLRNLLIKDGIIQEFGEHVNFIKKIK